MLSNEKWAEIIKDFNRAELPELIKRDIEIDLDMPVRRAVSIIGPRRSGKTYFMFQIIKDLMKKTNKEQILYVNLERADIGILSYLDLNNMLDTFYEIYPHNKNKDIWLFLDEIQNVSEWERFVRTAIDNGIKVFISGSSSRLLSKEIATSMRGRSISYTVLPFSFNEYLRANKIEIGKYISSSEKAAIMNRIRGYLENGGYPESTIYLKEKEKILTDIFETAIYRDVIERGKIRNTKAMRMLINALINAKEFSVHKFYNFLKSSGIRVGKNVLYEYIQHLNDAFFIFLLRKFSYSYKDSEQSIPKIYFIDNGLLRINGIDDFGRLMENVVFVELVRRNAQIAYYKDITKKEADFVIRKNKKVMQIMQVCRNLSSFETKDREINAILKASKDLRCNSLLIITWDDEGEERHDGKKIRYVPLWKWLLGIKNS